MKLRDIKNIEKVTMTSFLNQVPALRIIPKGTPECEEWAWLFVLSCYLGGTGIISFLFFHLYLIEVASIYMNV